MDSLPKRITENVPLFHASLFGSQRRDYTRFSEALVQAAILGVELKVAGRSHRNRFDVRDGLKDKAFTSAKDVNGFAFSRLIRQAAKVCLGCAQTVCVGARVSISQPSRSAATACNFHKLIIAYG